MPGIDRAPSGEQGLELLGGTAFAEDVANLVEIIRQALAGESQHEGLAEAEIA